MICDFLAMKIRGRARARGGAQEYTGFDGLSDQEKWSEHEAKQQRRGLKYRSLILQGL